MKSAIRNYALQNALKFNGKANPKALVGKIMGQFPEARKDVPGLMKEISAIVAQVNALSLEEQKAELEQNAPELLSEKPKPKRTGLPELKNVKGDEVIMRFEPSPSGPLHLGHAYVLGLNALYAKQYNAKLILRIADTNAGTIYVPAYEQIPRDATWLTEKGTHELIIQSSRLDLYYEYALQLIDLGGAYICTCSAEEFKETITKKIGCACRDKSVEENVKDWHKMFNEFEQGDAVMRLKTDVTHKNPALRDFPLFRINEEEHPKQGKKYRVWPLMNFAVSIDDHDSGITHILRAKDHADNAKRQELIFNYYKWPIPETIFVGKINFKDLNLSCSKTKPLIENGTFEGWDDIRLPFLPALRRRGYKPAAFMRYANEVGVTLNDKSVSKDEFFKSLNNFNKDALEPIANRYFFVKDPVKISVQNAPEQSVELDLHPDHKKGGRIFNTHDSFYISAADQLKESKSDKPHLYRLMDCLNFTFKDDQCTFDSKELKENSKIIHWLPESNQNITVEVRMPDNSIVTGLGESHLENCNVGDNVMFVRFGFCRLDAIENDVYKFWFTHK